MRKIESLVEAVDNIYKKVLEKDSTSPEVSLLRDLSNLAISFEKDYGRREILLNEQKKFIEHLTKDKTQYLNKLAEKGSFIESLKQLIINQAEFMVYFGNREDY